MIITLIISSILISLSVFYGLKSISNSIEKIDFKNINIKLIEDSISIPEKVVNKFTSKPYVLSHEEHMKCNDQYKKEYNGNIERLGEKSNKTIIKREQNHAKNRNIKPGSSGNSRKNDVNKIITKH